MYRFYINRISSRDWDTFSEESECGSDSNSDAETEGITENDKWWERWLETDKMNKPGELLDDQFKLMNREEKCKFLEYQRKGIEDERTMILEKEEGLRVEVKNLIKETMMFDERWREYCINRINNGNWDTNSEENDSNSGTETDLVKETSVET